MIVFKDSFNQAEVGSDPDMSSTDIQLTSADTTKTDFEITGLNQGYEGNITVTKGSADSSLTLTDTLVADKVMHAGGAITASTMTAETESIATIEHDFTEIQDDSTATSKEFVSDTGTASLDAGAMIYTDGTNEINFSHGTLDGDRGIVLSDTAGADTQFSITNVDAPNMAEIEVVAGDGDDSLEISGSAAVGKDSSPIAPIDVSHRAGVIDIARTGINQLITYSGVANVFDNLVSNVKTFVASSDTASLANSTASEYDFEVQANGVTTSFKAPEDGLDETATIALLDDESTDTTFTINHADHTYAGNIAVTGNSDGDSLVLDGAAATKVTHSVDAIEITGSSSSISLSNLKNVVDNLVSTTKRFIVGKEALGDNAEATLATAEDDKLQLSGNGRTTTFASPIGAGAKIELTDEVEQDTTFNIASITEDYAGGIEITSEDNLDDTDKIVLADGLADYTSITHAADTITLAKDGQEKILTHNNIDLVVDSSNIGQKAFIASEDITLSAHTDDSFAVAANGISTQFSYPEDASVVLTSTGTDGNFFNVDSIAKNYTGSITIDGSDTDTIHLGNNNSVDTIEHHQDHIKLQNTGAASMVQLTYTGITTIVDRFAASIKKFFIGNEGTQPVGLATLSTTADDDVMLVETNDTQTFFNTKASDNSSAKLEIHDVTDEEMDLTINSLDESYTGEIAIIGNNPSTLNLSEEVGDGVHHVTHTSSDITLARDTGTVNISTSGVQQVMDNTTATGKTFVSDTGTATVSASEFDKELIFSDGNNTTVFTAPEEQLVITDTKGVDTHFTIESLVAEDADADAAVYTGSITVTDSGEDTQQNQLTVGRDVLFAGSDLSEHEQAVLHQVGQSVMAQDASQNLIREISYSGINELSDVTESRDKHIQYQDEQGVEITVSGDNGVVSLDSESTTSLQLKTSNDDQFADEELSITGTLGDDTFVLDDYSLQLVTNIDGAAGTNNIVAQELTSSDVELDTPTSGRITKNGADLSFSNIVSFADEYNVVADDTSFVDAARVEVLESNAFRDLVWQCKQDDKVFISSQPVDTATCTLVERAS